MHVIRELLYVKRIVGHGFPCFRYIGRKPKKKGSQKSVRYFY